MYSYFKNRISHRKKGNLAIIVAIMVIVPVVALSMGQILLASESYSIRTEKKTAERYLDLSASEIAAYVVVSSIDGMYLDEIGIQSINEQCVSGVLAKTGNTVQVRIEDKLEAENRLQVVVSVEAEKNPVVIIDGVNLIEEITKVANEEVVRYIVDCSECNRERAVRYD